MLDEFCAHRNLILPKLALRRELSIGLSLVDPSRGGALGSCGIAAAAHDVALSIN